MVVIAIENEFKTSTSTSLDEKGVCQSSTPWHTPKTTQSSYSLVVEHIHGKDTAQVRFLVGAPQGPLVELADTHDLGSCAARREGSTPSRPTTKH